MTRKVSIHRRWLEPVPLNTEGNPIPKNQWPRKRRHCWVVRWFGVDGKRYQVKAESKEDAERIQTQKSDEFDKSPSSRNAPRKVTLGDFIDEFVLLGTGPTGRELRPSSVAAYREVLERFADCVGRNTKLIDITQADVTRFIAKLRKSGIRQNPNKKLSLASINKHKRTLKAAFNVARHQLGYLRENPLDGVKQDRIADETVRYLDRNEFASLLAAAARIDEDRRTKCLENLKTCYLSERGRFERLIKSIDAGRLWWQVFIALCFTAGTRLEEAINLTWADIDFANDTIRVIAKSERNALLHWQPKDKDSRLTPIPKMMVDLLAKAQVAADEGSPYVLISTKRLQAIEAAKKRGSWKWSNKPINNVQRQWHKIREAAGVAYASIHDLRRSAITNWARALPMHVTRELAGHAKLETTAKYYLAVTNNDMNAARKVTAEAFEGVVFSAK